MEGIIIMERIGENFSKPKTDKSFESAVEENHRRPTLTCHPVKFQVCGHTTLNVPHLV